MKTILLNSGETTLVDDIDFEFLLSFGPWFVGKSRKIEYARTNVNDRTAFMHRLIIERVVGYFKGDVDHKDGNGLNNQRFNLRIATKSQNAANRGPQENNTSGYKGVSWSKVALKWKAQIQINKTVFTLGHFIDPIEAAKVYDCAAKSTWKEFAWLNFPLRTQNE